jgi:hypothetical protein
MGTVLIATAADQGNRWQKVAYAARLPVKLTGALMLIALSVCANGMSFSLETVAGSDHPRLFMSGEIQRGDAARLQRFIAAHQSEAPGLTAELDSPGGDVDEAFRLGRMMRELLIPVVVHPPRSCVSACLFVYLSAYLRGASAAADGTYSSFGVHRPRFDADVTRGMTVEQAEAAHNAAFVRIKAWLQAQLVPQVLIDKLLSLPSNEVYWLSQNDIDSLGRRPPWFDEWLAARCPGFSEAERRLMRDSNSETSHRRLG